MDSEQRKASKMNLIRKIKGKLGIGRYYRSETSKVRHLVLKYCNGLGCDVGFGGDKIKKDAIGVDLPIPYAKTGKDKVDIPCDLFAGPIPVPDSTYDYVYSSHLIEDFEDTGKILGEFIRILKPGGNLILVFPDQFQYSMHCLKKGEPPNPHHVHGGMGLFFMRREIIRLPMNIKYRTLFESNCEIGYNVIIVLKITPA